MKNKFRNLLLVAAFIAFAATAQHFSFAQSTPPTSDIVFTVDFTGTPNEGDLRAADWRIDRRNAKLASQDPPGTPLPNGTLAERKASYLIILSEDPTRSHLSSIDEAAKEAQLIAIPIELWRAADDTKRAAAVAALQ